MKLLTRLFAVLAICVMALPALAAPVQAADYSFDVENNTNYPGLDDDDGYVGDEVTISGWWEEDYGNTIYVYYELFNESDEDDWFIDDERYSEREENPDPEPDRYHFDFEFRIPESCAGSHEILICEDDDPDDVVKTLTFTVHPFIEIDEDKGPAGTQVKVTGTGWDEDESEIDIRFYLEDPSDDDYDDSDGGGDEDDDNYDDDNYDDDDIYI